jgi:2-polyprenyl-3-methyl-5-hydroxy-6-metoxy-1,4-benzoquinol methylase
MKEEGIIEMNIEKETPKKKYDVIFMAGVLDHLHNSGLAMENISKCSRPGTVMYITIPNIYQIGHLARAILGMKYTDDPNRKWYTEANIIHFLLYYNWKVTDIKYNLDQGKGSKKLIRRLIRPFLRDNLGVTMIIRSEYLGPL